MATLTDNPSFTANEVYEIQQTDEFEGAATGASYGGIGLDNEPHQQLANRTAFLNNKRITDEANISALQAFQALFTGLMGASGYAKIPFVDVNRGLITAIVQWGTCSLIGQTAAALKNAAWPVNFPIAFPNACFLVIGQYDTDSFSGRGAFAGGTLALEFGALSKTGMQAFTDWDDACTIYVSNGSTQQGLTGFSWLAIGF